jgi:hypothetical protein
MTKCIALNPKERGCLYRGSIQFIMLTSMPRILGINIYFMNPPKNGAGVAQSVLRLATG